ncbi:hypothetical protein NDA14_001597 [Ustilago hordei]|nr:hypothetical protein NDA14_005802 [Ustilago hordei]KAJ1603808.1 hypothetical protein NDA14_001597 [Ustilago hordei]
MAGFYGIAKSDDEKSIRLDLDNELQDARFYTRKQILDVLQTKQRSHFSKQELQNIDNQDDLTAEKDQKNRRVSIRLPPQTAIARVLIEAWANGQAVLPGQMNARI